MLSIIVPVLNEAAGIAAHLAPLQALRARGAEVIVVDGGSDDGTPALAMPLADRVLASEPGRATQMNAGAAIARGDTLLFLHADTRLPADADRRLAAALAGTAVWGRFDVRIAGRHRLLPIVAALMNVRSRLTGIATGDQAIFVRRSAFEAVGRFPAQALMEDIELSARLKRLSRPACLAGRVRTAGRRWDTHGFWRTVVLMWRLRWAYWRGADPTALAGRYQRPVAAPRRVALLVFAKAPVAGACKTRLIPALGADGAARLAERLIERTLSTAGAAGFASLQLWCAPDTAHPVLRAAAARHGADLFVQTGTDLGQRMDAALTTALTDHDAALLIGTDCPDLTPTTLQAMANTLRGPHDVALIPATDGGYVLVGSTRPHAALFADIDWGSSRVLAQTRARAAAAGLTLHLGPTLRDLDLPHDLDAFPALRADAG